MVEKQTGKPAAKISPRKHGGKPADRPPEPAPVDRPGFDIGGSAGETRAGSGLGLGPDAAENRRDRRLPGRRGKTL